MKTFELKTFEDGGEAIIVSYPNGGVGSIPLDPNNSDYAEYLRYAAWVEAGNKPEDFWAQGEEL
jgi:hypothetical protein